MLSRDGAPVASRLTSMPPTQLGSGNDSGAGERRGMRDRPGDVVAIKPPIKRNGFAVALRNLRSGLVESAFSDHQPTAAVRIAVAETYFASIKTNLRTSMATFCIGNVFSRWVAS